MSIIERPDTSTAPGAIPGISEDRDPTWGLMAEFDSVDEIFDAARKTRAAGYRWWDCHTPFPVHGLDKAMGIKPTILPILTFFGGLTGVTLGLILQWFTNATSFDLFSGIPGVTIHGYDYLISGKPMISGPAWIPVMFEMTILLSALGCVGWMLLLNGLPMFYHPTLKNERFARATNDRFFVVIEARDPKFSEEKTREHLASMNPISIERLEP
ncbi:MAG: DUF3341 domain-containing protein [Phycisphaerales bacterium]